MVRNWPEILANFIFLFFSLSFSLSLSLFLENLRTNASRERRTRDIIRDRYFGSWKILRGGYWTGRDRWDVLICSSYRFDIGNWLAAFSKLRSQNRLLEI